MENQKNDNLNLLEAVEQNTEMGQNTPSSFQSTCWCDTPR